ncbi:SusC/RagA family TonB-linked outer membrane protein [Pedobacter foliorum]|uniref:SusC/RagA family TonB-linked outer membrane protein n=1 Tax=Pedobacter foliorum TaxID=2739058 RepID=UPI001565D59B|nr:SusC/RagA family TonB-linked outer membrane protein [Pedobacter foliorum]NRF41919.1 SusC/RagA family TonB-linked outer membrane protein [Pedobacter foliorum]
MKLATVILIAAIMQVSANGFAQRLTLNKGSVTLNTVFKEIRKQTGYNVLWKPDKLNANNTIQANFSNASLDKVMEEILYGKNLTYTIDEKTIIIKPMAKMIETIQEVITVTGTVTEKSNKLPLIGVNVVSVEDNKLGTTTDANGNFEIKVPANSKLLFKMIGFQDIVVEAKARLNIEMDQMVKELEEVVIGYGKQQKDLVTSSVVTMKMDEAKRSIPTTTLGNLLAGQMAGVRVNTPAGRAGTAPEIKIREKSSFNDQKVLFVIDGLVTDNAADFNNLSPNDVDNITTLKDAAATAAYGARASGGVIVVTTRRGERNQKAKINYSFNTGFDKRGKNAERTSAIETGEIYNRINPTAADRWTQSDFDYFKNINNGWGYDVIEDIWQDPSTTTHNLSASGGTDKLSYFVGGSYVKQNAFQKNTSFDKYNFRVNLTADITKNLTLFAGVSANNNVTKRPPGKAEHDEYRAELLRQPYNPVWTDAGNPIAWDWNNEGAEMRGDGGYAKENSLKPVINLKGTYKIPLIDGLSASAQYIRAFDNYRSKTYFKRYNMWVMKTFDTPKQISTKESDMLTTKLSGHNSEYLSEEYTWGDAAQLNFQLNYDHTFAEKHHVQGWLTYEKAENKGGGLNGTRERFPTIYTDQWWATSGDRVDSFVGGKTEQTTGRKSYVGQLFYDYSAKYLASFTFRYDGSYKFAPENRWGFFPSGSVGWVVSRENFFENVKGIDMLKIRASVGTTSADNVDAWQYQQKYENYNSAYFGTTPSNNVGIGYGGMVNPDITWEKTRTYNVGVDVNFLRHFNATAEYFKTKTYDILIGRVAQVPPTFSRSLPSSNYGEYRSNGVELTVGYRNKSSNLNYYANVNASYANAVPIFKDQNITYPYQNELNQSSSRVVTFINTGMLRTQADLDAFVAANPNYKFQGRAPELGQLTYADLSGKEGRPDGIVDDWDQTVVKTNTNPVSLGLNLGIEWKGISLDASFAGNLNTYRMVNGLVDGNVEWNRMWRPWAYDAWTPENPNASLPRRYSANDGTSWVTNTPSTFWLKRADFLRLRMLNVGYSLPASITNKMGIGGLKFYCSGSNLFIISGFNKKYYDPEIGGGFSYPLMKSFNFGVNLSL